MTVNLNKFNVNSLVCTPIFLNLNIDADKNEFNTLCDRLDVLLYDDIVPQIEELVKLRQPKEKLLPHELQIEVEKEIGGQDIDAYGIWVYYPWSKSLVHLLNKEDFITVRTNRNKYKITDEEQKILQTKSVGIIGLSVGQSIAVTLAMERACGELRLCDFDVLELSNYNRIRTKLSNLGLKKTVSVAREIMEIDPFLKVTCFHEGLNKENIDQFFLEGGKLSICVDECDGMDMKILCRVKAKEHNVPIVMEGSENCTIDVERFDLEPNRPLLHGRIEHLDIDKASQLKTNDEKVPYMMAFMPPEELTARGLASLFEVEETTTTWPQLASAVTYGGGILTDICRRILLNTYKASGRYQLDVSEYFGDKKEPLKTVNVPKPPKVSEEQMQHEVASFQADENAGKLNPILSELLRKGGLGPSGGNLQPWLWYYSQQKGLFQFIDKSQYSPLLDYKYCASLVSLGASAENVVLAAKTEGVELDAHFLNTDLETEKSIIAHFNFINGQQHPCPELAQFIETRITNRKLGDRQTIPAEALAYITKVVKSVDGADLSIITAAEQLDQLADIYGRVELSRLMDTQGHKDFMEEIRWSEEEEKATGDGINIWTADITEKDYAGFKACKERRALLWTRKWGMGEKFVKQFRKTIDAAGAMGLITMPANTNKNLFNGGRALQRAWLAATKYKLAFQPQSPATLLFYRLAFGGGDLMDPETKAFVKSVKPKFDAVFNLPNEKTAIFMFRLAITDKKPVQSYRRDHKTLLTTDYS